jgi:hypothetical protein
MPLTVVISPLKVKECFKDFLIIGKGQNVKNSLMEFICSFYISFVQKCRTLRLDLNFQGFLSMMKSSFQLFITNWSYFAYFRHLINKTATTALKDSRMLLKIHLSLPPHGK